MPSFYINSASNLQSFEKDLLNQASHEIAWDSKQSCLEYIRGKITGRTQVTSKIFHLLQDKVIDIIHKYDPTYKPQEKTLKLIVKSIMGDANIRFRDLNETSVVRKIFDKLNQGNCIDTVSSHELNFKLERTPGDDNKTIAHNVVKILMGMPMDITNISLDLIKGVFWKADVDLMEGFKIGLDHKVQEVSEKLQNPNLTEKDEKLLVMVLGNLLSLYPFSEPKTRTVLTIPQKVDGKWTSVNYTIETLFLSPEEYGSQIPALGLVPDNPEANPLLIFRGTPQPTASGSLLAMFSDVIPGYSVGEYIYKNFSEDLIKDWINKSGKKVNLYGQSLGGSLSLITLVNQPHKINEVHIYGSPSLLESSMGDYSKLVKEGSKPDVNIYWNHGDFVPMTGSGFHEDWKVYRLLLPKKRDPLSSHTFVYSAFKDIVVVRIDPKDTCQSNYRKVMNIFHHALSVILMFGIYPAMHLMRLKVLVSKKFGYEPVVRNPKLQYKEYKNGAILCT